MNKLVFIEQVLVTLKCHQECECIMIFSNSLKLKLFVILIAGISALNVYAETTSFTVQLQADYQFSFLGGTSINPGPTTPYIPFRAIGNVTFTLDPSINDPSEPTTVPFTNVSGSLEGVAPSPPEFLPHTLTPNSQFVGGELTNIVRNLSGEVVSADVSNLQMQWDLTVEAPNPNAGLFLVSGGSELDPASNLPFDAVVNSIPFALGDVLQGPDVGIDGLNENFDVIIDASGERIALGRKRTLKVIPEPTTISIVSLALISICACRRRFGF